VRLSPDVGERARRIRLLLFDVDGVLTDGRISFQAEMDEAKSFNARDGVGIRLAQRAGLKTGVITGRASIATHRRATELDMQDIHQRALDKLSVFNHILGKRRLSAQAVCFMGDDLVDIPIMRRVGLAAAPADADPAARQVAHFVTELDGGRGAAREVIDFILKIQGRWARVTQKYLQG